MNRDALKAQLTQHEGRRKYPYVDTVGKTSIGIGRNLTDVGLSPKEIEFLLDNDINTALTAIDLNCPWFSGLADARQRVVVDMVFNLGIAKFMEFKRTIASIRDGKYDLAAEQMLESKWARQVKSRAVTLADMMRRG